MYKNIKVEAEHQFIKYNIPKEYKTSSGIYRITNTINGKFYIGSTNNFRRRYRDYKCDYNKEKLHNIYLYRSLKKYGLENFTYEIECRCPVEYLVKLEKHIIQSLNPDFNLDFNIVCNRNSLQLEEYKNKRRQILKETKEKLGEIVNFRKTPFNGEFAGNSKLKEHQVLEIINKFNNGIDDNTIAKEFNITRESISRIRKGRNWKHFNHLVKIKSSNKQNRFSEKEIRKIKEYFNAENNYSKTAKYFNTSYHRIYTLINQINYV